MKTLGKTLFILFSFIILSSHAVLAQRGRGGHQGGGQPREKVKVVSGRAHHHNNRVVVVRSKYRPHRMVVYHPIWAPKRAYNRRWVYFPRYNFYWDNWRQGYYYRNNDVWIFNVTPPPAVININIENEKQYELKESEDDTDDVYQLNENHKTEYKPE